jgi:hypothetical protein
MHMAGGCLEKQVVGSEADAEEMLRRKLDYNDSLCGVITK